MSRPWAERIPKDPRPFPLAPLARRLGLEPIATSALSLRLGIDRRWIKRYRILGLTLRQADEWCRRVDVHPAEVWPTYHDLDRLRGVALLNAAKETCAAGHPLDRTDSAGRRRCAPCPAQAARRYRAKKSANTQLTAVMTLQEAS